MSELLVALVIIIISGSLYWMIMLIACRIIDLKARVENLEKVMTYGK